MRISHEVPKQLFEESLQFNDYDYALVHLFETEPEYLQFYKNCVNNNRHVILDNSIFELGVAFEPDAYAEWIKELNPTEYIIPDALEDSARTISNADAWMYDHAKGLNAGTIGVVQGTTYAELCECYRALDTMGIDKIAISFDYSYYERTNANCSNRLISWMRGRRDLLAQMLADGVINIHKPHHLLGCGLPQEFDFYKQYSWIDTIDTSNPIVHGIRGIRYTKHGLLDKERIKLVELLDTDITSDMLRDIQHNIVTFKGFCV